jgi:hypothetical protein
MKKVLPIAAYLLPVMALAQTGAAEIIGKVSDILNMLIPLIIGLAVVYFIWGILKYVTAGEGDSKAEARSVMIYGIIAIFVMVSVWGLVNLLVGTFELDNTIPSDIPQVPTN